MRITGFDAGGTALVRGCSGVLRVAMEVVVVVVVVVVVGKSIYIIKNILQK